MPRLRRELHLLETTAVSVGVMAPTLAMSVTGVDAARTLGRGRSWRSISDAFASEDHCSTLPCSRLIVWLGFSAFRPRGVQNRIWKLRVIS